MEKNDLTKIKNKAVNIVYECENKYYITEIVKVEKDFNGYGTVKRVTFNGLAECIVGEQEKVLFKNEFINSFQKSVTIFDRVPFGSKVILKCKPRVEVANMEERLVITYPKQLNIISRGEGNTLEGVVQLPLFNLYTEVSILDQLNNKEISYTSLTDEQKEKLNEFEIWRQQNIKKNKN